MSPYGLSALWVITTTSFLLHKMWHRTELKLWNAQLKKKDNKHIYELFIHQVSRTMSDWVKGRRERCLITSNYSALSLTAHHWMTLRCRTKTDWLTNKQNDRLTCLVDEIGLWSLETESGKLYRFRRSGYPTHTQCCQSPHWSPCARPDSSWHITIHTDTVL